MLITFSGMVGSGKSTCAKHVMNLLEAADIDCRYLRFRSLGLLGFRRRPRRGDDQPAAAYGGARWSGFQPRTLTAITACGYLARIVAFRLFGRPGPRACHVLDRFFYDSFVHYRLNTRLERWYMTAIRHVMPVPDVAVLLLATPETIRQRRPEYDAQYVSLAGKGYERLRVQFPELVVLNTDGGAQSTERLDALVREQLAKSALRVGSHTGRETV